MEWVGELIGFLILFLLFFFPLLRKLLIDKKRAEEPIEKEQKEEEAPPEVEELELPFTFPKAARLVKKDFSFESEVQERAFESEIVARHLEMHIAPKFDERIVSEEFILETERKVQRKNRITEITKNRKPSHAMIILSEILSKPKGMS